MKDKLINFLRGQLPFLFRIIDRFSKHESDDRDYTDVDITKLSNIYKHSKIKELQEQATKDQTEVTQQTLPTQQSEIGQQDRSQFFKNNTAIDLNKTEITDNHQSSEESLEENTIVDNDKTEAVSPPTLPSMVFKSNANEPVSSTSQEQEAVDAGEEELVDLGAAPMPQSGTQMFNQAPEQTVNLELMAGKSKKGTLFQGRFGGGDDDGTSFFSKIPFLSLFKRNRSEDFGENTNIHLSLDKTIAGHDETVRLKLASLNKKKSVLRYVVYFAIMGGCGYFAYEEFLGLETGEQTAKSSFKKPNFKKLKQAAKNKAKSAVAPSTGAIDSSEDLKKGMEAIKKNMANQGAPPTEQLDKSRGNQRNVQQNQARAENSVKEQEISPKKIAQGQNSRPINRNNPERNPGQESQEQVEAINNPVLSDQSMRSRGRDNDIDADLELSERLVEKIERNYKRENSSGFGDDQDYYDINFRKLGRGLVYNCVDKHWACVDKKNYFRCKKTDQFSRKTCQVFEVYASKRYCQLAQIKKINTNKSVDFCD
jgi:hypothetical protein